MKDGVALRLPLMPSAHPDGGGSPSITMAWATRPPASSSSSTSAAILHARPAGCSAGALRRTRSGRCVFSASPYSLPSVCAAACCQGRPMHPPPQRSLTAPLVSRGCFLGHVQPAERSGLPARAKPVPVGRMCAYALCIKKLQRAREPVRGCPLATEGDRQRAAVVGRAS